MTLVAPQALLLLFPLGLFLFFTARISGPPMWLRVALVGLLTLALARPEFRLREAGSDVVVVVDRSRSMPPRGEASAEELIRLLEPQRRPLFVFLQRRTAILALQRNAARASDARLLVKALVLEADTTRLETLRQMRDLERIADQPATIMVTAYDRDALQESAREFDLSGILEKPVNPSNVLDALMRAVSHQRESQHAAQALASQPTQTVDLRGARILLVEDNDINQELAAELLTEAGGVVEIANNGAEAVDMVRRTAFDAVLMDWQMPVMDGFEATRIIRADARFAQLPILAMTANVMNGDREKCLAVGMNDHISKPIEVGQMLETLARWINSKRSAHGAAHTSRFAGARAVSYTHLTLPTSDLV